MPLYFFDSHNGELHVRHEPGIYLPDIAQAKRTASRTLGDMARDVRLTEGETLKLSVNVRDQADRVLATASATFRLAGRGR